MPVLGIIREFVASHNSRKPHEHNFKAEIQFKTNVVERKVQNIDLDEIIPIIEEKVNTLRGVYLNDFLQDRGTLENVALYLINELKDMNNLYAVTVWEGARKYAMIYLSEIE